MSNPIVKVMNLTKKVKNKTLVKDLSFEINKGEIIGFLGPNGSGKTTTMKMMLGLTSITKGDILINEKSMKNNKEHALKYVSGIIEYPQMYNFLSGYDNLKHFQRIIGPINRDKIIEIIELVGLSDSINQKVKTYSLGMKQRLGIAQALLSSPDLLILDEPTNGLDPKGIHEIREYLKKLAKEKNIAIFISSHLLTEMELLCDKLIVIQNGIITNIENIKQHIKKGNFISICLQVNLNDKAKAFELLKNKSLNVKDNDNDLILYIEYTEIPEIINYLVLNKIQIYLVSQIVETLEERYLAKMSGGYSA